jgi:thiol-disulfide isomerase/thioredoxin
MRPFVLAVAVIVCGALLGCQATEPQLRTALELGPGMQLQYFAVDGSTMNYSAFAKQIQAGRTFELEKTPAGASLRLNPPAAPAPAPAQSRPVVLPAFAFTTVAGLPFRSEDVTDRPLLLSFFFSDCVPCIQETPVLNAFASGHPEYHYLAVTFDPKAEAELFVAQRGLKWPVVADAQPFISAAGVDAFPTYLLVSADGRILARSTGLDVTSLADPALGLKRLEKWVRQNQH